MKEKCIAQLGSFSLRRVLCAAAFCSMITGTLLAFFHPEAPAKDSHPAAAGLTFAERVGYQRAIEEVYWRHRIWPRKSGERGDLKPSIDAVISQAQIEKKVADYLRESQALEDYWQQPITAEQLQAEMDRMAQYTKQPEVLRELFEALGKDPFVIAECLARPVLAQRLFKSSMDPQDASDAVAQRIKTDRSPPRGYTLPIITTASRGQGTCNDAWEVTSTVNAPSAREFHTAVWTGNEMIIWGGLAGGYSNSGGRYNPVTDTWTPTSTTNAPAGRSNHTAVWTGSEMIVWGGTGDGGNVLNTGGRYNPVTDSWTAITTTNAPAARDLHVAVWTGGEMIVWGGWASNPLNTGGRYNPVTDSWTATTTINAPSARFYHTGVWSGSEMIVWGGEDFAGAFNTGGRYNPSTDSWIATSTTNAPSARIVYTAVWTGSEMIVWGGYGDATHFNTGGKYNPDIDTWSATSLTNAPTGREDHTAVWSGSEMIIWGGYVGIGGNVNTGGRYNPATNSWIATNTANAPSARDEHKVVWTGSEMIVWGGLVNSAPVNTGGRYCGPYPSPTPTPTPTACGVYEAWVDRYDDFALNEGLAIAIDSSGNIYVSGTSVGSGTWDYTTIKYNAAGQQNWIARYNGPDNHNDFANAMTIDASANVYVTGSSENHCGSADIATVKYNLAGQEAWVGRRDGGTGRAIAVDSMGNVYVTGTDAQGWATIKYNSSGAEQWVAHYGSGTPTAIAVDKAGNVYLTGASNNDYTTIKYDPSGQQQWVAQYNGPGNGTDNATGIALDNSGNVYITGYSLSVGGFNAYDYATIKYDASGQQQWVARYNGPSSGSDRARAIAVDELGNAYVTGESSGPGTDNYATVKYNSAGEQQWVARYSGPSNIDFAVAIALDGVGNVYVTGSSLDSEGIYTDYATVKYDSAGQEQCVVRYDGPGSGGDFAYALAVDGLGNVYVAGVSDDINLTENFTTVKYGQGPTPTPTPSATASPTATSTATPTATPTASPTPTVTCVPTATATPQPTPTPTATVGPSGTPSVTPTASASPTPTATATATIQPTATPTVRPTPTARPNITPRTRPTPAPRP